VLERHINVLLTPYFSSFSSFVFTLSPAENEDERNEIVAVSIGHPEINVKTCLISYLLLLFVFYWFDHIHLIFP